MGFRLSWATIYHYTKTVNDNNPNMKENLAPPLSSYTYNLVELIFLSLDININVQINAAAAAIFFFLFFSPSLFHH